MSDGTGSYSGVVGVAEWTDGLMVYGRDDRTTGGIWLSEDGVSWQAATVPDSPAGLVVFVTGVVRVEDQYLAFGTTGNPEGSGPVGAVLWGSDDGRVWTELSADIPGGLLAVNGQTILVGSLWDVFPTVGDVYESHDGGSTWSSVPRPGPWHLGPAIVHHGGYLLGGGVVTTSTHDSTAAIWSSRDGVEWGSRVDLEGRVISAFASLPDGTLVALGLGQSPTDAGPVWTSSDGVAWSLASEIGTCCISNLASTPDGIVGVGFDAPASGDPGLVATTRDARSWSLTRGIEGDYQGVVYIERFGIVISGRDPAGRPAVIVGWPFGP